MATIFKTPSGTWKTVIRKQGWPTASKTYRTKHDAEDWSRRAVYIDRTSAERLDGFTPIVMMRIVHRLPSCWLQ